MKYQYLVTVETDYANIDAPDAQTIANEIQNNLEYEAHKTGITDVKVEYYDEEERANYSPRGWFDYNDD